MKNMIKLLSVTLILSFAASTALAAQSAVVGVDATAVYSSPDKNSKILEKLTKGTKLPASNNPTQGFFKVRTPSGKVGWVESMSLVISGGGAIPAEAVAERGKKSARSGGPVGGIRLLAGTSMFSVADVNNALGFKGLANGLHYGADASLRIYRGLSIALRIERIQKPAKGILTLEDSSDRTFELALTSYPLMLGLELEITRTQEAVISLGGFGGTAFGTRLVSTETSASAPNQTIFTGSAPAAMGKLDIAWLMSKSTAIYVETGYRYQTTASLTAQTKGNGSDLYTQEDGSDLPVKLNLSGLLVSVGLGFQF
jgi:hypothetical protein